MSVVTVREPGTEAVQQLEGVEIHRVRVPRFLGRYLFILLALPVVLRQAWNAEVIHASVYGAAFPAWLCGAILRKPTVLTVYEVFGDQWQQLGDVGWLAGWFFRVYEWFLLHLPFSRVICISQFTSARLQRFARTPRERISVVYPAVDYAFWDRACYRPFDLRHKLNLASGTLVYLYFGRPGASKGVDTLLAAANRIKRTLPASRLVMLLSHEPAEGRRRVLEQIRDLGIEDHVVVLDPVPRAELPGYLLAADCVVVPSVSEGFGYSAVEAATLGCRVVATSGHAVEEVLGDSVHLVPPRDPEALARAVLEVATTTAAPRQSPRCYTLESQTAGILEVYTKATAGSRSGNDVRCSREPGLLGESVPGDSNERIKPAPFQ